MENAENKDKKVDESWKETAEKEKARVEAELESKEKAGGEGQEGERPSHFIRDHS